MTRVGPLMDKLVCDEREWAWGEAEDTRKGTVSVAHHEATDIKREAER